MFDSMEGKTVLITRTSMVVCLAGLEDAGKGPA